MSGHTETARVGHTPGPWSLGEANHCIVISTADDTTRTATAIVADCAYLRPSDEVMANARLIAAAPDLLVAVRELLNLPALQAKAPDIIGARAVRWAVYERARKALAKAEASR